MLTMMICLMIMYLSVMSVDDWVLGATFIPLLAALYADYLIWA
jgi:hypothetical protein